MTPKISTACFIDLSGFGHDDFYSQPSRYFPIHGTNFASVCAVRDVTTSAASAATPLISRRFAWSVVL